MAIFGDQRSFASLVKKIKTNLWQSPQDLEETLDQIAVHPDAKAKNCLFMLAHDHPRVREAGLSVIAELAGDEAVGVVLGALVGADGRARLDLASKIVAMPIDQIYRGLGPLVHSNDPQRHHIALDVIAAHPQWKDFLGFIKRLLKCEDSSVRLRAATVLNRGAGDPTVRLLVMSLLHDEDDAIRHDAIRQLCSAPAADLVEPFFERLPHESRDIQARMIDALGSLSNDPQSKLEEYLIPILADDNPTQRDMALTLISKMPSRTRVLRAFFIHSKGLATWLRDRTIKSMMRLKTSFVEPLLVLMEDSDYDVALPAMMMAGDIGDPAILPSIKRIFMSDSDWWIRSLAAEIMVRFEGREIEELLISKLDDRDLRYTIVAALGKIRTKLSTAVLLECLDDADRGIRCMSLDGLRGRQEQDVAKKVFGLAACDHDARVRTTAANVLESFGEIGNAYLENLSQFEEGVEDAGIDTTLQMENDTLNEPSHAPTSQQ